MSETILLTAARSGEPWSRCPTRPSSISISQALVDAGVELVSTGSTGQTIAEAGLPVTSVEEVTGFPECLDGRVKTLTPRCTPGCYDVRLSGTATSWLDLASRP